jgi:ribose transport system substrate-binding protein
MGGSLLAVGCSKSDSKGTGGAGTAAGTGEELKIAVIPKGTTHSYWKSVEKGARAAGAELGVKILWNGPLKEDDRTGQISVVQQFISDKVNGIVLAPLDDVALVNPVKLATSKGIPVVIIDSALKAEAGKDFTSFVATNNHQGGMMGGEELARVLGGKGKIVLLRYSEGSASTEEREAGFLEAIHKHPGMTMLVDNRYAGATIGEAQQTAGQMLDQLTQADGIFCPNESTTMGMLLVLRQNNLVGKVHFVGFDATPTLIDALKKGEIDALVSQNPTRMGYLGVKTCVEAIKGEKVDEKIDSGVQLITRDNLNTPEVQKLLAGD